ncbi:MAG: hypothetical protein ACFE8N_12130 [Promethearchaeota archaeon]
MRKKPKIMIYVVAALAISGGAAFGIVFATTWGSFEYSDTFFYEPSVPSPLEKISINSDVGKIAVRYNTTPTNYFVKIELNILMRGGFVEGKTFSDFFKPIVWSNESTPVTTFSLENKPWGLFALFRNITIDVTLRTDVLYDISAVTATGSVSMDIPGGIAINTTYLDSSTGSVSLISDKDVTFLGDLNLDTSTGSIKLFAKNDTFINGVTATTSTGSLTLNFSNCIMGDDLTGLVSTGSIELKSYNMLYTQDCIWNIDTATGSVDAEIYQYVAMGANVTGSIQTSTGSVDIIYKDTLANVGAKFTCSTGTGSITYTPTGSGGFNKVNGDIISTSYTGAIFKYTLGVSTGTGSIEVIGESA